MKSIWILAESRNGHPLPAVLEIAAAARAFTGNVEAVTHGPDVEAVSVVLGDHGVSRCFDIGELGSSLPGPPVSGAIHRAISAYGAPAAIFVVATNDGRDVAARLSVKLDVPVIANVVGLTLEDGQLVSEHAIFGGTQIARSRFTDDHDPAIFVVRPKSFASAPVGGQPAEIVPIAAPDQGASDAARIIAKHAEARNGPSLDDARIVVSGGRGLGAATNYQLIEDLATLLKGAPGASRAIVDAGWVPYAYQIGQTGMTVKPDVYLAFGISGAIQHLVGMKSARRIIAVNKDSTAPIFGVADLGIVADALDLLPRLISALQSRFESIADGLLSAVD